MKPRWKYFLVTWLLLAGVSSGGVDVAETMAARARELEIPELQVRDARAPDVLAALSLAAQEADEAGQGINILFHADPDTEGPRVTVSLRKVSVYEAIRAIAEAANLWVRFEENAVVLTERSSKTAPIVTRVYAVQAGFPDAIRDAKEEEEPLFEPFFR